MAQRLGHECGCEVMKQIARNRRVAAALLGCLAQIVKIELKAHSQSFVSYPAFFSAAAL